MLRVTFKGQTSGDHRTLDPVGGLQLAGNFVRELPSGVALARYERFHWAIGGAAFIGYECEGASLLYFEDALGGKTAEAGPYHRLRVTDGVMYADGVLFARFTEVSQLWLAVELSTHWPMLKIVSA